MPYHAKSASLSELAESANKWCGFRPGCLIAQGLLPEDPAKAQDRLREVPLHLAEALVGLGYPRAASTVDLALAIQEGRCGPPAACSACTSETP
jgi:hypothetical protein